MGPVRFNLEYGACVFKSFICVSNHFSNQAPEQQYFESRVLDHKYMKTVYKQVCGQNRIPPDTTSAKS